MTTILIVDDNPSICEALGLLLSLHGFDTLCRHTPEAALALLEQDQPIELAILDMNFSEDTTSGEEGRALFYRLREWQEDLPIILLTAWTQLDMAVELVKTGAADYQGKPWDDDKLITSVKNLLELNELRAENLALRGARQHRLDALKDFDLCGLVFESAAMHNLVDMALQVAPADVPVLITGPNGCGKEKIAEILQANSALKDRAFIRVNVGALPAELLEAELFGAEPGAYTGLNKTRIGRFEAADGGTLFLDEIGNLSLEGQAKLLRVVQFGEFERLGSHQTRKVRVRIISATNANLEQAIAERKFREDLYYRLNVIELKVPALKDRTEDILPLAEHFLGSEWQLNEGAERALLHYPWPGNIRELQNRVARAKLLGKTYRIDTGDLDLPETMGPARQAYAERFDKSAIEAALNKHQGVVARAARSLGLTRQALYRRMIKFDIECE